MPELLQRPHLDIADDVRHTLEANQPVVALESTIICHGMPYPRNVETALAVEAAVRDGGAVPATIAILNGRLKVGLSEAEIEDNGRLRAEILSIGIPILLADGKRLLRGPSCKAANAEDGWVDLRPVNMQRWQDRLRSIPSSRSA